MKTITLLLILCISVKTVSLGGNQGSFTGGWSAMEKESLDALQTQPFWKKGVKINAGYQQVVAGMNYVLSIQDGSEDQAECGICLYFVPWMNKLTVNSCVELGRDDFLKYEFDNTLNECEQSLTKDPSSETKLAEEPVKTEKMSMQDVIETPSEEEMSSEDEMLLEMPLVDGTSK